VVKSMTSKFSEHTNGNYFLHTGAGVQGRPSMGAWISYGLGSENQNLPAFIVLNGGFIPPRGLDNFNSGFFPAPPHGPSFPSADPPVANLRPLEQNPASQRAKLDLLKTLDRNLLERTGNDDAIDSAVRNYETAFRMQTAIPELMDIRGETEATRRLYGLDSTYP